MHLHSIEVALQGGPVPPRFISIKWGGTSAPPEFTGGYIFNGKCRQIYCIQYIERLGLWMSIRCCFRVYSDHGDQLPDTFGSKNSCYDKPEQCPAQWFNRSIHLLRQSLSWNMDCPPTASVKQKQHTHILHTQRSPFVTKNFRYLKWRYWTLQGYFGGGFSLA